MSQKVVINMDVDISIKTLRERVYGYLKEQISSNRLREGEFLDLKRIGMELGMSRTPLRDALFQLESEGFITIYPRRGVMLNVLDMKAVRDIYEIIGALEASVLLSVAVRFSESDVRRMAELDGLMQRALEGDDFDTYYGYNVDYHNTFLGMSENWELLRYVRIQRERLYDFPRRRGFLKEWEQSNLYEHVEMTKMLDRGDFESAAAYLRDVHWSFSVQERFIRKYYFALKNS
jgi:DNA-binding GntR family transcriptional regulator